MIPVRLCVLRNCVAIELQPSIQKLATCRGLNLRHFTKPLHDVVLNARPDQIFFVGPHGSAGRVAPQAQVLADQVFANPPYLLRTQGATTQNSTNQGSQASLRGF